MNATQGTVLFYAGLFFILNILFPPTTVLNGSNETGRAWLWANSKSINTIVNDSSGKSEKKKPEPA